ncbi:MAG: 16S rRNA (cytosine(1402)-N(4))-methyltransferase RsmH [Clostridia bacterium]|nr:16S rRNA (cytosine(1402)-N(4))-methyltransferase RsmH [Clostridia bacterium]
MEFKHEPIMLKECIENLNIKPNGIYVDGTIGGAGHSSEIVKKLSKEGLLIGIDRDTEALEASKKRLKEYENVKYVWGKHENIKKHINNFGIEKVDGILLDLGVSSYQIDEASRGFSYTKNAKLDMRMNKEQDLTAMEVVNNYKQSDLEKVFFEYGEERFSKKIASRIVRERENKKIETTYELADLIRSCVPNKIAIDSLKRIFQALRIEVNGELKELEKAIKDSIDILNEGGRICIITFHSLEDRIVKNTYIEMQGVCKCPKDFPKCVCGVVHHGKIITRKPIVPTEEEQERNPRSKSAKLRVFEKGNI